MNINQLSKSPNFGRISPLALNNIREEMKSKGATPEEYDNLLQTIASDYSGDNFTIETREPDGRSAGKYRVLNGKGGFDLGILYTLKDAVKYVNSLTNAKSASKTETKLNKLKEAEDIINPTLWQDYGTEGSNRIYKNMERAVGLDVEA